MNLMDLYKDKLAEQDKEREEKARLEEEKRAEYAYTIASKIEEYIDEGNFKAEAEGKPTLRIALVLKDATYEQAPDLGIESLIIEKLEKDEYGPIECLSLTLTHPYGYGILTLEATLTLIDYQTN